MSNHFTIRWNCELKWNVQLYLKFIIHEHNNKYEYNNEYNNEYEFEYWKLIPGYNCTFPFSLMTSSLLAFFLYIFFYIIQLTIWYSLYSMLDILSIINEYNVIFYHKWQLFKFIHEQKVKANIKEETGKKRKASWKDKIQYNSPLKAHNLHLEIILTFKYTASITYSQFTLFVCVCC